MSIIRAHPRKKRFVSIQSLTDSEVEKDSHALEETSLQVDYLHQGFGKP